MDMYYDDRDLCNLALKLWSGCLSEMLRSLDNFNDSFKFEVNAYFEIICSNIVLGDILQRVSMQLNILYNLQPYNCLVMTVLWYLLLYHGFVRYVTIYVSHGCYTPFIKRDDWRVADTPLTLL